MLRLHTEQSEGPMDTVASKFDNAKFLESENPVSHTDHTSWLCIMYYIWL